LEGEYCEDVFAQACKALKNQPMLPMILSNPVTNYLMDWYLMSRKSEVQSRESRLEV